MVHRAGYAASATLAGLAGLHVAWGVGASFPFTSRAALADAVVGTTEVPPPAACYSVAAALAMASGLAADVPLGSPRLRVAGRVGVAIVLGARGILGLSGRTDLVSPASASRRFRRLDRRLYSPLCLLLGTAVALSASG